MRYHFTYTRMTTIKMTETPNVDGDVKNVKLSLLMAKQTGAAALEDRLAILQKVKKRLTF